MRTLVRVGLDRSAARPVKVCRSRRRGMGTLVRECCAGEIGGAHETTGPAVCGMLDRLVSLRAGAGRKERDLRDVFRVGTVDGRASAAETERDRRALRQRKRMARFAGLRWDVPE